MAVPDSWSWLAEPRREGPQSVSVWGGKGGIGKSTDALILAYTFSFVGPTLLINADKKQQDGGVSELFGSLAVPANFDITETESVTELAKIRTLRQYRFVITDHGPYRDEGKLREAANADLTVVPTPPKRLDSKAVIASTKAYLAGTNYRIHLTKVDHISKGRARSMKTTLQDLGIPVFSGWMRMYNAHEMLSGYPVFHPTAVEKDPKAANAAEDAYLFASEALAQLGLSGIELRDVVEAGQKQAEARRKAEEKAGIQDEPEAGK